MFQRIGWLYYFSTISQQIERISQQIERPCAKSRTLAQWSTDKPLGQVSMIVETGEKFARTGWKGKKIRNFLGQTILVK